MPRLLSLVVFALVTFLDASCQRVDFAIYPFAGRGTVPGRTGDGGPATLATLYQPIGLAVDALDNTFVSEGSACDVRIIYANSTIATFAGTSTCSSSVDGLSATSTSFLAVAGLQLDSSSNLYIGQFVCLWVGFRNE